MRRLQKPAFPTHKPASLLFSTDVSIKIDQDQMDYRLDCADENIQLCSTVKTNQLNVLCVVLDNKRNQRDQN